MWERKRGRLGLHTKSLKSPRGTRGRHVPSGKLIVTQRREQKKKEEEEEPGMYKCVKGTKDEALDAGPERKGTQTGRIIRTSSVKSSGVA